MKEIGIFEAKTKLSEICKQVEEEQATYVITRRGKPMARIVPVKTSEFDRSGSIIEDLRQLEKELGPLSDEEDDFPPVWEERTTRFRDSFGEDDVEGGIKP